MTSSPSISFRRVVHGVQEALDDAADDAAVADALAHPVHGVLKQRKINMYIYIYIRMTAVRMRGGMLFYGLFGLGEEVGNGSILAGNSLSSGEREREKLFAGVRRGIDCFLSIVIVFIAVGNFVTFASDRIGNISSPGTCYYMGFQELIFQGRVMRKIMETMDCLEWINCLLHRWLF